MNEIWKPYLMKGIFDEKTRLEFSVFGEVKSYNVLSPNGRLINGGLQQGYPIIRFKRFKEMDAKDVESLQSLENEIKSLKDELRIQNKIKNKKNAEYKEIASAERKITKITSEVEKLSKKLKKDRNKINKKRSVYHHIFIHKAVAELFLTNDDPINKTYVLHKNFNKLDNNKDNLIWATKEEVTQHSFKSPKWIEHNLKLERSKTVRRGFSKLNYNDVVLIKRKLSRGEPMSRLARRFGVSDMQIHRIKTGENWGDVKLNLVEDDK